MVEEQNKYSCLREQIRLKDVNYRRLEQECDSLGFRNKQLELRCASLQEDLEQETKNKSTKSSVWGKAKPTAAAVAPIDDEIIGRELQSKIFENAKLASTVEDKNTEIKMYAERLQELEDFIARKSFEHAEMDRKLKREIENLASRNTELESRLVEVTSTLGSEDGLSVAGSDCQQNHALDERIAHLEKELNHWRTQYEVMKINQTLTSGHLLAIKLPNGCQATEDSFITKTYEMEEIYMVHDFFFKFAAFFCCRLNECNENVTKEQLLMNSFSKRVEAVLFEKRVAESKVTSYIIEVSSQKICCKSSKEK